MVKYAYLIFPLLGIRKCLFEVELLEDSKNLFLVEETKDINIC